MCGISGIINCKCINSKFSINYNLFKEQISHRGPDNFGEIQLQTGSYSIILTHYRLAIQGVGNIGNQPWLYNQYTILFNGEIYNYINLRKILESDNIILSTNCDTELIPHLFLKYGPNFVNYINGIFSIIIFDSIQNKLYLFRDFFGIKPLYYAIINNTFIFSSELSSFKILNLNINSDAVYSFLIGSYNIFNQSYLSNVFEIEKGTISYIDLNKKSLKLNKIKNYKPLFKFYNQFDLNISLKEAINEQLIGDVPIGISLSGGLDSSIILEFASKNNLKLIAYTIDYGFNKNDVIASKLLSKKYNIPLKIINIYQEYSSTFEMFDEIYKNISEPIGDTAYIGNFLVCKYAKKDGVKVILSGAGGDEIFGGYSRYTRSYKYYIKVILRNLLQYFNNFNSLFFLKLKNKYFDTFTNTSGCFNEIINKLSIPKEIFFTKFLNINDSNNDILDMLNFDMNYYLVQDILKISDLSSMVNGIEVRVPLLDYNLLNQVRMNFKNKDYVYGKSTKAYLRKQMKDNLPIEVLNMKKNGFGAPIDYLINNSKEKIIIYLQNHTFRSLTAINNMNYRECSNNLLLHLFILAKWEK